MAFRIDIPWEQPLALTAELCQFKACYQIESDSGDFEPDDDMRELWEKYRARHAEHVKEFARRLVQLYRDCGAEPADLPKKEILNQTQRAIVEVWRRENDGEKDYFLMVSFVVDWDEHFPTLVFDEGPETFEWEG